MIIWSAITAVVLHTGYVAAFTQPCGYNNMPVMLHLTQQCSIIPTAASYSTSTVLNLSSSSSSEDIQAKLKAQMAKLQERDRSSRAISSDVSYTGTINMMCDSCLII